MTGCLLNEARGSWSFTSAFAPSCLAAASSRAAAMMLTEPKRISRYLAAVGDMTDAPARSLSREPEE